MKQINCWQIDLYHFSAVNLNFPVENLGAGKFLILTQEFWFHQIQLRGFLLLEKMHWDIWLYYIYIDKPKFRNSVDFGVVYWQCLDD